MRYKRGVEKLTSSPVESQTIVDAIKISSSNFCSVFLSFVRRGVIVNIMRLHLPRALSRSIGPIFGQIAEFRQHLLEVGHLLSILVVRAVWIILLLADWQVWIDSEALLLVVEGRWLVDEVLLGLLRLPVALLCSLSEGDATVHIVEV